jgi:polysaccharide pyruvyl transferase CsaB
MGQPRILILAGDADGNLGDHAILQASCAMLRRPCPGVAITVVSDEPERCRRDFGAEAVPRGLRSLQALARAAARSDLVLCGGGGLFQDDDSLVKMPYWALRVAMARLFAPRVVGYALGVGPLDAAVSRWSARLAFACMERVTVRDERAKAVAQPLSSRPVELVPDPALALAPASREAARACLAAASVPLDGRPLIGVAPRRWFPRRRRLVPSRVRAKLRLQDEHAGAEGRRLVSLLAATLDRLAASHDAHILFLPTYRLAHEGDDQVALAIARELEVAPSTILRLDDAALYKAVCGELAFLIAGRMHPAILAAPMGTPLLALAYNPKFDGFFALLGRSEHIVPVTELVRDIDALTLAERAERAWAAGPVDPVLIGTLQERLTKLSCEILAFSDGGGVLSAPSISL